ncbi:MAG TPA: glycoside hydrolase family 1 protein [Patescibacteria group bacterium]|nr:glycoside hydrolase family 1 protein [Patescibacteria group bacterium]
MTSDKFPNDFLWGASTSSYQVEGGNHGQWSTWEEAHAKALAKNAPQKYGWFADWEAIKAQATDPANYICGKGVDHYNRYAEDFALIKKLGLNTFRFGIEWSRVEPREGEWDQAAIKHYHEYIARLRKMGIEPMLTLWHWTMPEWFTNKRGFEKRRNLKYFERYVAKMSEELGAEVTYVLTLNEPNVYAALSYGQGIWPPQDKNPLHTLAVYYNLMLVHKRAYRIWKQRNPQAQISIAAHLVNSQPASKAPTAKLLVKLVDYAWNWWYLDRIKRHVDFIGLNYYFTDYYTALGTKRNPKGPYNDMGWYMEPRGIEPLLLKTWRRYKIPIIITENGLADAADTRRQWWIEETLASLRSLLRQGVDLRGYLHWSLLDNFEWSDGWRPRFGLVAVDRTTMQRTIRPSAGWFAEQIKQLTK